MPTNHTMHMNLVKDSLEEELDDTGSIEPSAKSGEVIKYKYN